MWRSNIIDTWFRYFSKNFITISGECSDSNRQTVRFLVSPILVSIKYSFHFCTLSSFQAQTAFEALTQQDSGSLKCCRNLFSPTSLFTEPIFVLFQHVRFLLFRLGSLSLFLSLRSQQQWPLLGSQHCDREESQSIEHWCWASWRSCEWPAFKLVQHEGSKPKAFLGWPCNAGIPTACENVRMIADNAGRREQGKNSIALQLRTSMFCACDNLVTWDLGIQRVHQILRMSVSVQTYGLKEKRIASRNLQLSGGNQLQVGSLNDGSYLRPVVQTYQRWLNSPEGFEVPNTVEMLLFFHGLTFV